MKSNRQHWRERRLLNGISTYYTQIIQSVGQAEISVVYESPIRKEMLNLRFKKQSHYYTTRLKTDTCGIPWCVVVEHCHKEAMKEKNLFEQSNTICRTACLTCTLSDEVLSTIIINIRNNFQVRFQLTSSRKPGKNSPALPLYCKKMAAYRINLIF